MAKSLIYNLTYVNWNIGSAVHNRDRSDSVIRLLRLLSASRPPLPIKPAAYKAHSKWVQPPLPTSSFTVQHRESLFQCFSKSGHNALELAFWSPCEKSQPY